MKIIHTTSQLQQWRLTEKNSDIGFVPTMGVLHSGHSSLLKRATTECDIVVLSIFVNPTQFGDSKDLDSYPRTLKEDAVIAKKAGVDVVFAPTAEDLYGGVPKALRVEWGDLTSKYEASHRPGHFDGVVAVVDKLFQAVRPQKAYFGEKDLQQVSVVRRLAHERYSDIEIVPCELIRDRDGLALSSRNTRLSITGRISALKLFSVLTKAKKEMNKGADREETQRLYWAALDKDEELSLEYLRGVNERSFSPEESPEAWTHIVVAAQVDGVRLIDNIRL